MRWKFKPKDKTQAHRWFAWHPIYVEESRTWVWFETVTRKCTGGDGYGNFWFYRLLKD